MRELLQLVVIDLTADENAQEIFETLNARASPQHAYVVQVVHDAFPDATAFLANVASMRLFTS
ncbi:hypothetical protein B4Q13_20470 [Lacticaseibacillus rhamnosus]